MLEMMKPIMLTYFSHNFPSSNGKRINYKVFLQAHLTGFYYHGYDYTLCQHSMCLVYILQCVWLCSPKLWGGCCPKTYQQK